MQLFKGVPVGTPFLLVRLGRGDGGKAAGTDLGHGDRPRSWGRTSVMGTEVLS